MSYVSRAFEACKKLTDNELFSWAVKGTGAAIAGGVTAYLLQKYNVYAPALPIAIGSAVWSLGEATDAWNIYRRQAMDTGGKINLCSALMRMLGSAYLSTSAALVAAFPESNSLDLVAPIVQGGATVGLGYGTEYGIGRPRKREESERWHVAGQYAEIANRLRDEKIPLGPDDWKMMRELYTKGFSLIDRDE